MALQEVSAALVSLRQMTQYLRPYCARRLVLRNRRDIQLVRKQVEKECLQATGALVVYYCGHALDRDDELYLCFGQTSCADYKRTALRFRELGEWMVSSPARKKLLILDCCHAEIGLLHLSVLQSRIGTEGVYALAAAQSYESARTGKSGGPTLFTGELHRILTEGPRSATGRFSVSEVFQELKQRLDELRRKDQNVPTPAFCAQGTGDQIIVGQVQSASFDELVAASIGLDCQDLPAKVRANLEVIGLFRAKQLAWELRDMSNKVRADIQEWSHELENALPDSYAVALVVRRLKKVRTCREILHSRIMFDCASWGDYLTVAERMYKELDDFYGRVWQLAGGRGLEGSLSRGKRTRGKSARLVLSEVKKGFKEEVEAILTLIPGWARQAKQLYDRFCSELTPNRRSRGGRAG